MRKPQMRRRPGLGTEPAGEGARAHRHPLGQRLRGVLVVQLGAQLVEQRRQRVRRTRADRRVDVLRLAAVAMRRHHHAARDPARDLLPVVLTDEVQAQVQTGRRARRREHRAVADEQHVRIDARGRVQRGEFVGVAPVRRAVAAVQHAGGTERERTRAHAHDPGTAFDGLAQQVQHRLAVAVPVDLRRDDDQIRLRRACPAGAASRSSSHRRSAPSASRRRRSSRTPGRRRRCDRSRSPPRRHRVRRVGHRGWRRWRRSGSACRPACHR